MVKVTLILHVIEKVQFLHFSISPGSAETLVRRGGITKHHLIAYVLSNISAKNYQNRLKCVEVIVCNISVVFLRHSVHMVSMSSFGRCVQTIP